MRPNSDPPKVIGEDRGMKILPALGSDIPPASSAEKVSELKAAAEFTEKKPYNFGDPLGFIGLAFSLIAWAIVPGLLIKAVAVFTGAGILAYLAFRSHFTRNRRSTYMYAMTALVVLVWGGWHLLSEWKDGNPKGLSTITQGNSPGPGAQPTDPNGELPVKTEMGGMVVRKKKAVRDASSNELNASIPVSNAPIGEQPPISAPSSPKVCSSTLFEGDAEWAIGKALDEGKIDDAECFLLDLHASSARGDECQRAYSYADSHAMFADALKIVNICWDGRAKQEKIEEIDHEKLKQQ